MRRLRRTRAWVTLCVSLLLGPQLMSCASPRVFGPPQTVVTDPDVDLRDAIYLGSHLQMELTNGAFVEGYVDAVVGDAVQVDGRWYATWEIDTYRQAEDRREGKLLKKAAIGVMVAGVAVWIFGYMVARDLNLN